MSNKTPEMEAALEGLSKLLFDNSRSECIADHKCVICGNPVEIGNYEPIDVREFYISGIGVCCWPSED